MCRDPDMRFAYFTRMAGMPSRSDQTGAYRLWLVLEDLSRGREPAPVERSPEGKFFAECYFQVRHELTRGAGPISVPFYRRPEDMVPIRVDITVIEPHEF
jgi:hypothetical protein